MLGSWTGSRAATSLGQVYKGVLKENGEVVAVKRQRPAVLETVSIDLYVLRKVGVFLKQFPAITTDVVGLLDEWAGRFFEELDYNLEGSSKQSLPRASPRTCHRWSFLGRTQSIRDVKLSPPSGWRVRSSLRAPLATSATWNIGVICYLKQLLDTGFFHADPHPGNLIRTPDGRLAILDFGLMTDIDDNIKYGMIEAISRT